MCYWATTVGSRFRVWQGLDCRPQLIDQHSAVVHFPLPLDAGQSIPRTIGRLPLSRAGANALSGITISMDGKGRCMDNIFVERLWRSRKYEEVYLNAYASVAEAKADIGAWLDFYNEERSIRASDIARHGKFTGKACGYVDDRLCRPAALPSPPEPARKLLKISLHANK